MRFPILRCLAKAVVKHGIKFLCNLAPGGGAVYDFAADVVEDYRRDSREDALRAELQALAQAPTNQVHQQVEADVQAVAADQPSEVRQALTAYLTQVPAAIRRSLRRPSDPTGTTVPATLALSRPEDLMAFLPSRPPRFRPGDRPLPGVDWELEELVGVGGFGEVWKARHVHLRSKAPVALKFCLDSAAAPSLRNEAGMLDRMMRHGRHPGIVPLLNTYLSADPPCLEYEFVEGGDLAGLIQDLHGQGRMTPDVTNRLFRHLVEIVAHAHRADPPIVHGDLKPANVLVRRGSDGKIGLRVTDFGIGGLAAAQAARESRQPTRSQQELLTEAVRGAYTPLYASPEQMTRRRGEPADPRDDVHALGVIWHQLLTGDLGMLSVPPDWREQVEERGLDGELVKLLASCIASRAAKRTASAVVLAEQLVTALSAPQKGETETSQKREQGERLRQEQKPGELVAVSLGGSITMKFAWCPPGTFLMGSSPSEAGRSDDETQHRVTLTHGFHLGIHPVTQAQWQAVMADNPSKFKGGDHPVEQVSWDNCQAFCVKLGQLTGKRYRLPTEAEWEYACRAGTTTPFYFGETISTDQANYDGNSTYGRGKKGVYRQQTTPVGRFPANAWGLFDMHGNVWEWCADWYGAYIQGDINDPQGCDKGSCRVLRGGTWNNNPSKCRSATRYKSGPTSGFRNVGCRVVLCLD
ncbi:MAG TPA: bifunctional serine/threonine-protein kinase/formylglycine-generating enzyme family protein [Gemmataceae bacterium]|jgi:formylglycine-generating enzyme required for sulfatase activity